jgi:hypothetical protein
MRFFSALLGFVLAIVACDAAIAHAATHVAQTGVVHFAHDYGHALVVFYRSGGPIMFSAVLSTGNLTLADWAKRVDPQGKVPVIIELLSQRNEILEDMTFMEGNLPVGHRVTVRTGLPAVAYRLLNAGIVAGKSTTAQIDEQAAMLEAWSEVDCDLAKLNGNVGQFRLSESKAFIEAMNQQFAQTLFYGNNGTAPEQFTGLSPRYSLSTAPNGDNVIKAGGSGSDNSSIWLIVWSDEGIGGIFPKGSVAGLQHDDYGEQTLHNVGGVQGARMRAYQERWQWKGGIAVKDWRFAVRICNVDISDLNAAGVKTIINFMEQALETVPDLTSGRPAFYMNRTIRRFLRREVRESVGSGGGLTFENFAGKRTLTFSEVPVRRCDQLLNTEALVS